MAICPAGHETSAHDFCDTCGLPVQAQSPDSAVEAPVDVPAAAQPVICPNCQTPNVADALFCEACGFDFTTGTLPQAPQAEIVVPLSELLAPEPDEGPEPDEEPQPDEAPGSEDEPEPAEAPRPDQVATGEAPSESAGAGPAPLQVAAPDEGAAGEVSPAATTPAPLQRPAVDWVAELWIDPDWYAAQGSSDPMPSPSLPDIAPLVKENNLIGRVSHSRGIFPDIDCELDTGCSRRHAMLSTDGNRWWIEDLDSANGTFVGAAAGPLPAMPIPQGRVELNPGQRIYVGAWTRIVVRKATEDEKVAFAG